MMMSYYRSNGGSWTSGSTAIESNVYCANLEPVEKYIHDKFKVNTARIYPIMSSILGHLSKEMNDEISIANRSFLDKEVLANYNIWRAVVSDDIASVGIELIYGRAPTEENEYLVPKTWANALVNGNYDSYEDIVKDETSGIVGVFEDNLLEEAKEYADIPVDYYSDKEEEENGKKLRKILENTVKMQLVVMGSASLEIIKQQHVEGDVNSFDVYNELKFVIENYNKPGLQLSPNFVDIAKDKDNALKRGEVYISKYLSSILKDSNGNSMGIGSSLEISKHNLKRGLIDNTETLKLTVVGLLDISDCILSSEDYMDIYDNYELTSNGIFFDIDNLSLYTLNKISKFTYDNVGKADTDSGYIINYFGNKTMDSSDQYSQFHWIKMAFVLPLLLAMAIMLVFAVILFIANAVKERSNELLYLHCAGANTKVITWLLAIFLGFALIIIMTLSVAVGSIVARAISTVLTTAVTGVYVTALMFDFDILNVITLLGIVSVTNVIAYLLSVNRALQKNIRKAMQKKKNNSPECRLLSGK